MNGNSNFCVNPVKLNVASEPVQLSYTSYIRNTHQFSITVPIFRQILKKNEIYP